MAAKKGRKKKTRKTSKKRSVKKMDKNALFRRNLFYTICLFVVFQLMLLPLQMNLYPAFWGVALLGFGVVLAELLYSRVTDVGRPIQFDSVQIRKAKWREHFLHHAALPGLLYVTGVFFLYFNRVRVLDQVAVLILSGVFFVIFSNISATYRRMYSVSRDTRVVFDFINIITFFFFIDVLINLVLYEGISRYFVFVGAALMTFALIGMMVAITKQSSLEILLMLLSTSIFVGLAVVLIWSIPVFNIAVISLVSTIAFYLADVYWHHRLEGSFSWEVMSQYALFALMAIILVLYL
mgnify:CR=1 FL=1